MANRRGADRFNDGLPELIARLFSGCNVLLYQAGADAHVNDPLGGWMTTEQLARLDAQVFATAKRLRLAGRLGLGGRLSKGQGRRHPGGAGNPRQHHAGLPGGDGLTGVASAP